jgi:endonuclease/exonuclease/phosphatase family metal-dependent hydrolase
MYERPRLSVLVAIVLGGLLALTVSHSSVVAQFSPPTASTVRVMTWNIQSYKSVGDSKGDFGIKECEYAAEIIERGVSVVALQEVQRPVAENIVRCLTWLEWLRPILRVDSTLRWDFRWIEVSDSPEIPLHGMAILSKYPIIGSRGGGTEWELPKIRGDKLPKEYARRLQRVTLALGSRQVHVYNVHLGFGKKPADADECPQKYEQVQECQVGKIVDIVGQRSDDGNAPLILGDFNVEPWSHKGGPGAISVLTRAGFVDAWAAFHPGAADFRSCSFTTFPVLPGCGYTISTRGKGTGKLKLETPKQRADYIFARDMPELRLVDVWSPINDSPEVQNEFGRLSDHYPITATLRFQG